MSWSGLKDFLSRAEATLDPVSGPRRLVEVGEGGLLDRHAYETLRPAAVLIPVLARPGGATVLLTRRPETMTKHAGQVAFPGGKLDPSDRDAVAAALREADEEVGVHPQHVRLVGRAADYLTASGFRITPVVGVLPTRFTPLPDHDEVAAVFETPLSFLMDPSNHTAREVTWRGARRRFYEMPHGGYHIWGVTAGIIRELYLTLYERASGQVEIAPDARTA